MTQETDTLAAIEPALSTLAGEVLDLLETRGLPLLERAVATGATDGDMQAMFDRFEDANRDRLARLDAMVTLLTGGETS